MKIAFVTTEAVPFAKAGGLADVAGSLPKALIKLDCEVKVFMPKYPTIDEWQFELHYCWEIGEMPIRVAGIPREVHVFKGTLPGSSVEIYFIDSSLYFNRQLIYTNDKDEDERLILFTKAVIETCQRLKWAPDVFHCNDWPTGLLPVFTKDNYNWDMMFHRSAIVFTIHNIEYQGIFNPHILGKAELKHSLFFAGGPLEFHGNVSLLKAGIVYADIVNTVSDTYAREILSHQYGTGMEKILNNRKNEFFGVLNGADYETWDPEIDKQIPFKYSIKKLSAKQKNKRYLLDQLHLPFDKNIPLIGMISRLVSQKGFDIFVNAVSELMKLDAQWIILGTGDSRYENIIRSMTYAFPNKVASYFGFNNKLAHLIEAGADMFLMPSRYEPCGLNQIYSLRYGTVPIVRKTGGLADTVQDWHEFEYLGFDTGTGFAFNEYTSKAIVATVQRALEMFKDRKTWRKIQKNGMKKNYSWDASAKKYYDLYKMAIEKRKEIHH
jgi:starch synthase